MVSNVSTQLLGRTSALTRLPFLTPESIGELAADIREGLVVDRVSITMRPRLSAPPVVNEVGERPVRPVVFQFARPLKVRGVNYGRLEVESSRPQKGSAAVETLEAIRVLLGVLAESHRAEETNDSLRMKARHLQSSLVTVKLVARAGGIVSELLGSPLRAAEDWIRQEAVRTNRSAAEIADRIILHQQSRLPA